MGTDIHIYAEVKKYFPTEPGNSWNYFPWKKFSWFKPTFNEYKVETRCMLRDSTIFYALGAWWDCPDLGVKSAILKEKDRLIPKGLPNDLSDEVKKHYNDWETPSHSHNAVLVSEIINLLEILKKCPLKGYLSEREYRAWKVSNRLYPSMYRNNPIPETTKWISQEELDTIIKFNKREKGIRYGTSFEVLLPFSDSFYNMTLINMFYELYFSFKEDVRVVYWFDS